MPDGVINVIPTLKHVLEVGKEMCENKVVKKVTFTGSTPVAKLLYGMASSTLKKLVLLTCFSESIDVALSLEFPLKLAATVLSSYLTMLTLKRLSKVRSP